MAVPVHLCLRGPGLPLSLVAVAVAMLVPLNLDVLGLLVSPLVVPLTVLVPRRMRGPGP